MAILNIDEEKYNEMMAITEKINEIEKILFQMSDDMKNNNIEFKNKDTGEHYKEMLEFLDYNRRELISKKEIIQKDLLALNDKGPVPTSFV